MIVLLHVAAEFSHSFGREQSLRSRPPHKLSLQFHSFFSQQLALETPNPVAVVATSEVAEEGGAGVDGVR